MKEKLSLCFIADLHIGARRRMLTDAFMYSSIINAIKGLPMHAFDIIFILGDIFDSPEPSVREVLIAKHVIKILREEKLKNENGRIVTIAGNHDMPSSITEPSAVELLDSDITSSDRIARFYDVLGMRVYAIPAGIPIGEVEEKLQHDTHTSNLIIMHYPVEGAIRYDTTRTVKKSIIESIGIPIAMGDIHDQMFISDNKFYASSIIEAGFGETNLRHGYVTADFLEDTREITNITFFENIPVAYTFDMKEQSPDEIRHKLRKLEETGNNPAVRIINATEDFNEERQSFKFSNFIVEKKKKEKEQTERTELVQKHTTEEKLVSWLRLQNIDEAEIPQYVSLYRKTTEKLC